LFTFSCQLYFIPFSCLQMSSPVLPMASSVRWSACLPIRNSRPAIPNSNDGCIQEATRSTRVLVMTIRLEKFAAMPTVTRVAPGLTRRRHRLFTSSSQFRARNSRSPMKNFHGPQTCSAVTPRNYQAKRCRHFAITVSCQIPRNSAEIQPVKGVLASKVSGHPPLHRRCSRGLSEADAFLSTTGKMVRNRSILKKPRALPNSDQN
jgi:hypothetical protein